jgi:glycosyltransferase involved in cell wall biosynthesis
VKGRILVIGHDAYRAGAQVELLHVLRWMRAHIEREIHLLLLAGGDLLADYATVVPTRVLPRALAGLHPRLAAATSAAARRAPPYLRDLARDRVDLVFANSVGALSLAAEVSALAGCPLVCHVHDLELSMSGAITRRRFGQIHDKVDCFIAVSEAVRVSLVVNRGVEPDKITVIPPGVPAVGFDVGAARIRVRSELGLADDAFVVGGSGTTDWRKGPDLFVATARALADKSSDRPIHFVWVGGDPKPLGLLRRDVERAGLSGRVTFVGRQTHAWPYHSSFDAFLLTSREDPFPLVCLESARLSVPTICFAGAGGMPEFVEEDAGCVIPYLDLQAAAGALLALAGSEALRSRLGRRAAQKVHERCDLEVVGSRIGTLLDHHLESP